MWVYFVSRAFYRTRVPGPHPKSTRFAFLNNAPETETSSLPQAPISTHGHEGRDGGPTTSYGQVLAGPETLALR